MVSELQNNAKSERKDDLFMKVSIENLQNGLLSVLGFRNFSILTVLASYADSDGECFPSYETLAKACGCTPKTIERCISALCKVRIGDKPILLKELLRIDQRKTKNVYKILPTAGMAFGDGKVIANESLKDDDKNDIEYVKQNYKSVFSEG